MAKEDWRQCVDWLVRCQVLTPDHHLATQEAQVFELAQFMRDGVLICHLLNRLQVGAIDSKDFSQRPQMSQFLCLKNIRVFLHTCRATFSLKDSELFEPNDLFDVKDFGKVINTLSIVSCSPKAQKSNIHGFKTRSREDYFALQALTENGRDEDIYSTSYLEDDNEIYEDLCSLRRRQSVQELIPVTKRDYCIKELVETERNYVDALTMIINIVGSHYFLLLVQCFIKKLKNRIVESDLEVVFGGIEGLHVVHVGFCSDVTKACCGRHASGFNLSSGTPLIADCFIKWKERFLLYGEFCSNLPKAQAMLDKLMNNPATQAMLLECQRDANGGKFRLRDLLSVPMQRVLKYHLILKELVKNTDMMHPERRSLERALDEMQDLSVYVNEVKRDNENLQLIGEVENSIIGLVLPDDTHLRDYGRLLKDGELRVKRANEKKDRGFSLFLFDKVLLVCKSRGDGYGYKDSYILSRYDLEETPPKDRERHVFQLVERSTREATTFIAKTADIRTQWIKQIMEAQDNECPVDAFNDLHEFIMANFTDPTICDVCRKLLRGVFYQGYRCLRTDMVVHKMCIVRAKDVPGRPVIVPRQVPVTPVLSASRYPRGKVRAISSYHGMPEPPEGLPFITFEANETFSLLSDEDVSWWEGRIHGREGMFPKSFVIVQQLNRSSLAQEAPLTPSTPPSTPSTASSAHSLNGCVSPLGRVSIQTPTSTPPSPLARHSFQPSIGSSLGVTPPLGASSLAEYQWFVGERNRDEATRMMEPMLDGTFLIRVSNTGSRRGEYALSVRYGIDNPVKHIKVQRSSEGMYFLIESKMFRSIPELVQYYQMNSLERSFSEIPMALGAAYRDMI